MHFEILVEDISGKTALDILVPKIIGNEHTFQVHSYKGVGRIPKNLKEPLILKNEFCLTNCRDLFEGMAKHLPVTVIILLRFLLFVILIDDV